MPPSAESDGESPPPTPFEGEMRALRKDREELHTSTLKRLRQYWMRIRDTLETRTSERARDMVEAVNQTIGVIDEELKRRSRDSAE